MVCFKKDQIKGWALFDFNSEVNTIILAYLAKLGFKICQINIKVYKIENSMLKIFVIVLANFLSR